MASTVAAMRPADIDNPQYPVTRKSGVVARREVVLHVTTLVGRRNGWRCPGYRSPGRGAVRNACARGCCLVVTAHR